MAYGYRTMLNLICVLIVSNYGWFTAYEFWFTNYV